LNYSGYIVTIKGRDSRAVCFFQDGQRMRAIVNRGMKRCKQDIESSVDYLDEEWYRWIEWAVFNGKLRPVKPHYKGDEDGKDTTSYLLPSGRMHIVPGTL
jgi:hypothetical protein